MTDDDCNLFRPIQTGFPPDSLHKIGDAYIFIHTNNISSSYYENILKTRIMSL